MFIFILVWKLLIYGAHQIESERQTKKCQSHVTKKNVMPYALNMHYTAQILNWDTLKKTEISKISKGRGWELDYFKNQVVSFRICSWQTKISGFGEPQNIQKRREKVVKIQFKEEKWPQRHISSRNSQRTAIYL